MIHRYVILFFSIFGLAIPLFAEPPEAFAESPKAQNLQKPLFFEPNRGQAPASVRYLSRGNGHSLFLLDHEAVLAFADPAVSIRMSLGGQNPDASLEGAELQRGVTNYFRGNDRSRWSAGVPHFAKVKYTGVYPGIDLTYYGKERQLEYDFEVQPFADLSRIQMDFEGMDAISIGPEGDLILSTPAGEIRHRRPVAYQRVGFLQQSVEARFVLRGNRVGFEVGRYDQKRPLIIDPKLVWSTYLGGTGEDLGNDLAVDSSGNVYVTGYTYTVETDTASNPPFVTFQTDPDQGTEMFVTKLDSSGALVFTTYVGGTNIDEGHSIAVDSTGTIYVTGYTTSMDFPMVNAFQSASTGVPDCYIVKLNSTGSVILLSSYIGGSRGDRGFGIALDTSGSVYVAGETLSRDDFPVSNAIQPRFGGGQTDGFITKISPAGTVSYSTHFGGTGLERIYDIAVDTAGDVVFTGWTSSDNRSGNGQFPVVNAVFPNFLGAPDDIFIAKLNSTGTSLIFSTFFGGAGSDIGVRLALDSARNIYVTGYTSSFDFPLKNAPSVFPGGGYDGFLVKLHPDGQDADFSVYVGAEDTDGGVAVAVDKDGFIYLAGFTESLQFYSFNSLSAFLRGPRDGFVMKLYPDASNLVYSSYFGGFGFDGVTSLALDDSGDLYLTGFTSSGDFAVTDNALQKTIGGGQDAFLTKIDDSDVKTSSSYSFVPGGGTQVVSAGQSASVVFGYAELDVTAGLSPTGLAIIDLRSGGALVNEVTIPIPIPADAGRVFTQAFIDATTALTMVNGNDEEVTVYTNFIARPGGGTSFLGSFTIPAHFQVSALVTSPPFNIPFQSSGALTYSSTLPVSAIGLLVAGTGTATPVNVHLPILNPYVSNDHTVVIPQIADGEGWTTTVYLTNPTEETISGEIRFFKGGLPGEPSVPHAMSTNEGVDSVFQYTIDPRSAYSFFGSTSGDELVSGFAEVVPTAGSATPQAVANLQYSDEAGFTSTAVEGIEAGTEFKMFVETSGTFQSADLSSTPALALANSSDSAVTVNLSLVGFDGLPSLSAQLILQPREHVSTYLAAVPGFENLPNPYLGILRVTTSDPGVTVAGFRARYNELGHYLITSTGLLRDLGNLNPIIYPHLVDGGGYATQLILINGTAGGGASGTIRYLDASGRPLNLAVSP